MVVDATVGGRTLRLEIRARGAGYHVTVDGRPLAVDVASLGNGQLSLVLDGHSHDVAVEADASGLVVHSPGHSLRVTLADASAGPAAPVRRSGGPLRLAAPMPGRVLRVLVEEGAVVEAGQGLLVVEAMKMENELRAPRPGRVERVAVREGQAVEAGALLLVIE